jgi:sRNA-binding protein
MVGYSKGGQGLKRAVVTQKEKKKEKKGKKKEKKGKKKEEKEEKKLNKSIRKARNRVYMFEIKKNSQTFVEEFLLLRRGENMSLNCGHQRAYCSSPR